MFDFASLERRVAALEARAPASLRCGKVTGVEGGAARVQLDDGQGVVTMPLPTLQRRVLKDQEIKMPDIGEPVAALFSGQAQGQETGVVLGAVYSPAVPDPGEQSTRFPSFRDRYPSSGKHTRSGRACTPPKRHPFSVAAGPVAVSFRQRPDRSCSLYCPCPRAVLT
jgi:hypothetical protein